jgi:hypothetical protein
MKLMDVETVLLMEVDLGERRVGDGEGDCCVHGSGLKRKG